MKENIGSVDKLVRVLLAIIILLLDFTNAVPGKLDILLLVVAVILLITAFINFCPVWHLPGITTKKKKYIKQQEKLN